MRGIRWISAVLIALVMTAASSWSQTSTAPVPPVPVLVLPTPVTVSLTENQLTVTPTQAPAGAVDFIVTNNGTTPHALTVSGPGARVGLPNVLQPGQTATLHLVGLQQGNYVLIDPVGNNASRGLTASFTVTPPAIRVLVSLTEYRLIPSQNMVMAGNVEFLATNSGTTVHSLAIQGAGVNQALPTPLQPGQSATLRVENLQPGTYSLYCPLDNHAGLGMQAAFTVTPADVAVSVSLMEYRIGVSQTWAPAGNVVFVVTNNGTVAHTLGVRGPGVDVRLPGVLQPGQTSVLRVPMTQPGSYRLYCPVNDHDDMGMVTNFTVLAQGALPPAVVGQGSPPPETLPPDRTPQNTTPVPEQ